MNVPQVLQIDEFEGGGKTTTTKQEEPIDE